jgi:hypothetical protein
MANYIHAFEVHGTNEQITAAMPKRARVMAVGHAQNGNLILFATVTHDTDTRAFDVGGHQRHFRIVTPGQEAPTDGVFIGLDQFQKPNKPMLFRLVYEVSGIRMGG